MQPRAVVCWWLTWHFWWYGRLYQVLQYRIADKQALDLFNLHTFHWRVKPSCECQVSPSGNGDLSLLLFFFFLLQRSESRSLSWTCTIHNKALAELKALLENASHYTIIEAKMGAYKSRMFVWETPHFLYDSGQVSEGGTEIFEWVNKITVFLTVLFPLSV